MHFLDCKKYLLYSTRRLLSKRRWYLCVLKRTSNRPSVVGILLQTVFQDSLWHEMLACDKNVDKNFVSYFVYLHSDLIRKDELTIKLIIWYYDNKTNQLDNIQICIQTSILRTNTNGSTIPKINPTVCKYFTFNQAYRIS